jgi:putative ABC transport system permease protein
MLRATWRSLLARKLRLLLASVAVLLGVSFVSGAYVLTDSLSKVFDNLFASINSGTSVLVRGVDPFATSGGGSDEDREPVTQAVLDRVKAVDGVREAEGSVSGLTQLVLPDGKALTKHGPPTIGVTMHAGSSLESLRVKSGKAPVGPNQVAVDASTASKQHLSLGDQLGVVGKSGEQRMTLVGTVGFATSDSLAGATLVAVDGPTSQRLFGTPGTWTALSVAAADGVSDRELRDRVAQVLPKTDEALTSAQSVAESSKQLKQVVSIFNTVLQVFAGVSLFVGMFLIFNTFAMLVAQRTRELALLRALGANRGQVTRSVLLEAVVIGVISSLGGFLLGIAVAVGLKSLLGAVGIELPNGPTVVQPRTFVASLVVGVLVTSVAALVPARRAARVAPVQAMRESGPAEDRSLTRRSVLGSTLLAVGAAALLAGLNGSGVALVGVGAAVSFVGVTVVSPLFARPVVQVLGWPFARLGVPGRLGRGNAMRSPRRTSATAAALMIGLALVAAISTLGASVKKSVVQTVNTSFGADYVLHTEQYQGFSPTAAKALLGRPELAAVAGFRQGRAAVGDAGKVSLQGVDPAALRAVLKLDVVHGSLASLQDELAVSETEASNLGVKVGDTVPVTWARTGEHPLRVGAVYADNQFAGGYLVSDRTYDANVTNQDLVVIAVKAAPGTTPQASRAAITSALSAFPNLKVEDKAQFVKAQGKQVDTVLNLILLLLGLSVLIAMLGIINTLALSVVERTRELGLLRAVGLQRRQLRLMIAAESVVIAVYGALLGVAVGLLFGYALVTALHDQGITEFAVPWARIAVVLVAAALGGVVAAALPARRAARMDVLAAVSSA